MNDDLQPWLDAWPYNPDDDLMVRRVPGPDGLLRLQVRVELGLLELHTEGRPDGQRPFDHESLLAFWQSQIRAESEGEVDGHFSLDHDECRDLQREANQYYHRRISWLRLGDYPRAAADARHSLAIMDLLEARAADRADWHNSEQFRCFVLGHLIRAEALDHLTREDRAGALQVLDHGIDTIEAYFRDTQQRPELASGDPTLSELRDLRQSVLTHVPLPIILPPESDRQRLERELGDAIAAENYEQAAVLRDQLRLLD